MTQILILIAHTILNNLKLSGPPLKFFAAGYSILNYYQKQQNQVFRGPNNVRQAKSVVGHGKTISIDRWLVFGQNSVFQCLTPNVAPDQQKSKLALPSRSSERMLAANFQFLHARICFYAYDMIPLLGSVFYWI